MQYNETTDNVVMGVGYNSDQVLNNMQAASSLQTMNSMLSEYRYFGIFSRLNYRWKDRYITNLTARRDGSSRFGANNQFNNFGAVGLAWIFSEENLFKQKNRFLSFGKLRGSYGITGSDQIGDYQFLNIYYPYSTAVPYQNSAGFYSAGIANPYIKSGKGRKSCKAAWS